MEAVQTEFDHDNRAERTNARQAPQQARQIRCRYRARHSGREPICHVGYTFKGSPFVTPTLQWREGDHIYWHGSSASRMLEACERTEVCVTVSIVDGIVMARSAFNHSCNYRSVMVFGTAFKVKDPDAKQRRAEDVHREAVSRALGYSAAGHEQELKATTMLALSLEEARPKCAAAAARRRC